MFGTGGVSDGVGIFDCVLFQAEDGLRNLVRSRGLGDVYKRQHQRRGYRMRSAAEADDDVQRQLGGPDPVSYTHLTPPTSDLV